MLLIDFTFLVKQEKWSSSVGMVEELLGELEEVI